MRRRIWLWLDVAHGSRVPGQRHDSNVRPGPVWPEVGGHWLPAWLPTAVRWVNPAVLGGLFKREFKEIQANGSPERCEVAAEWPPVVGVENAPGLDVGDCALDWGAQAAHVRVELLLPFKQVPVLWFLDRRDVTGSLISLVADTAEGRRDDLGVLRLAEDGHVVVVSGERFGNEDHVSRHVRYDLAAEASRLMLSRPQARYSAPGPARRQEAVYQDCLAAGGGLGLLGVLAEPRGCLFDEGSDLGDDPGNARLGDIEDLCPDVLDDVLPCVPARHDDRFPECEFLWPAGRAVPWSFEVLRDTHLEFVELLRVEP